jgi:hypothetical protein
LKCVKFTEWKNALNNTIAEHWRLLICAECKKELKRYFPAGKFYSDKKVKPNWVTN